MNWQFPLDYLCASFTLLPPSFLQLKLLKTSRRNIIVLFPIEEDVTGLIQKSTIHLHMHPPLLCNLICSLPLVELMKSLLDLLLTEWPIFLHSLQQDLSAKSLARCPKKQTKPLVLILGFIGRKHDAKNHSTKSEEDANSPHSIKRRYAKITILLHTIPRRLQTKIILHHQKKMQKSLYTIKVTIEIVKNKLTQL